MELKKFLEELGSSAASPGGGAAAALTGATGAALVEMVTRINARRRRISPDLRIVSLRRRLNKLMTLDARAYSRLSSFPKENRKESRYQAVLVKAAGVPFETGRLCVAAFTLAKRQKPFTSRWLMSDLVEAGILLKAAFKSAQLNVEINLPLIRNRRLLSRFRRDLKRLAAHVR